MTKLPDGRVIKGPRQEQRKNAEFWTDIEENADALLDGVHNHQVEEAPTPPKQSADEQGQPQAKKAQGNAKSRNRATSAAARSKIASKKRAKMNGALPRPSRRGFKWPTP